MAKINHTKNTKKKYVKIKHVYLTHESFTQVDKYLYNLV